MTFKAKIIYLFLFALLGFFLSIPSSWAGRGKFLAFIEPFPNGKIDWDSGYFYGTGIGYPHLNRGSKARALKVAQAGALSAILQVASRLRVDDQHTLEDLEKKRVIIQIRALVMYEPYERHFIKKDPHPYYRVTYRAPMKGVKGLTKKLLTRLRSRPPSWQDLDRKKPMGQGDESGPWLVLDARGLAPRSPVQPAIFPKIVTEDGAVIYDLNIPEQGALVERGMARYVVSDKSPEEIGCLPTQRLLLGLRDLFSLPLARAEEKRKRRRQYIVKNVSQAKGIMRTNLVISEGDARDIRDEDASSRILKKCRVVVIVSSSLGGIEGKLLDLLAFFR